MNQDKVQAAIDLALKTALCVPEHAYGVVFSRVFDAMITTATASGIKIDEGHVLREDIVIQNCNESA